jgi:hypothetical protein
MIIIIIIIPAYVLTRCICRQATVQGLPQTPTHEAEAEIEVPHHVKNI